MCVCACVYIYVCVCVCVCAYVCIYITLTSLENKKYDIRHYYINKPIKNNVTVNIQIP